MLIRLLICRSMIPNYMLHAGKWAQRESTGRAFSWGAASWFRQPIE
jgi:hypothetical protein